MGHVEADEKQTSRRKLLLAIGGMLSFCALIGGWLLLRWANAPVVDVPQTQNDVKADTTSVVTYAMEYFTTTIPSDLVEKVHNTREATPILGQYLLKHSNVQFGDQLAITVGAMNEQSIEGLADVKLRRTQPERYAQVANSKYMPQNAVTFFNEAECETAVFWVVNNRFAAVVVSGTADRKENLAYILETALAGWQWQ